MDKNKVWYEVVESQADIDDLRSKASKYTLKEMAVIYDISVSKLYNILRTYEIKCAKKSRMPRKILCYPEGLTTEYVKEHTIVECCKEFSLSRQEILSFCKEKQVIPKKNMISSWAYYNNKGRLRSVYYNMLKRCYKENNASYKDYGGRGITVCPEWREDCKKFFQWAKETGYTEGLQIDRIDVNGNYEPNNCRWVTPLVNSYNKRNTKLITYKGETKTLLAWEKTTGIPKEVLWDRLNKYNWEVERALTEKVRKVRSREC